MDEGYIRLYRTLAAHGHLASMPDPALRLFIMFLLRAEWRDGQRLPRGCLEISYSMLLSQTPYGRSTISRALDWLENPPTGDGYIRRLKRHQRDSATLRIQVVKWDKYQSPVGTGAADQSPHRTGGEENQSLPGTGTSPHTGPAPATSPSLGLTSPSLGLVAAPPQTPPSGEAGKKGTDHVDGGCAPAGAAAAEAGPAQERDALGQVERYLEGRVRALVLGGGDLAEVARWVRDAGGDVALIERGIDAGLKVHQHRYPGELPRNARYYGGFVAKEIDRARQASAPPAAAPQGRSNPRLGRNFQVPGHGKDEAWYEQFVKRYDSPEGGQGDG